MGDTDKSASALRRKVLKLIGSGSAGVAIGGSAIPAVAIERDQQRRENGLPPSPNYPEPEEPSTIGDFDPYNPRQAIWLQNFHSKMNGNRKKKNRK